MEFIAKTASDEDPMDYAKLYKDVNQISMKWEKTEFSKEVVIHRMYVRLEDLDVGSGTSMLPGYEKVERLYVFADVVELPPSSKKIRLPGSDKVVIVCRLLYHPTGKNKRYTLPSMKIRMEFSGITNTPRGVFFEVSPNGKTNGKSDTAAIGIKHGSIIYDIYDPNHQTPGQIICSFEGFHNSVEVNITSMGIAGNFFILDMGNKLTMPNNVLDVLRDHDMLLGMQATVLIAELVQVANNVDLLAAMTQHIEWLNDILIQVTKMQGANAGELNALLFRVQAFLKLRPRRGLLVPKLRYDKFEGIITTMVDKAREYDHDFKQLKLFIAQNQITGTYLLQQNKALAEKEKAMDSCHSQILSLMKTELRTTIEKMNKLGTQMEIEKATVQKAESGMKQEFENEAQRAKTKALFAVVYAIGAVALTVVTAGAAVGAAVSAAMSAVKAGGEILQGLKKVAKILKVLQKVMEVVKKVQALVDSLSEMNGLVDALQMSDLVDAVQMPEMPSDADWEIFVNEVERVAEEVPIKGTEVSTWKIKCKNVAALGKEMITTAAHISDLQYRIIVEEMLQKIAKEQADRLESIKAADLTNYMEMATQIDMRTTRLLMQLIQVLYVQNPALMYEYLQTPVLLNSWPLNMETIWTLLLQQKLTAILGLQEIGTSTRFKLKYVVKDIPVRLMLDAEDWYFDFPLSEIPKSWSRVRIRYIEAHFVDDNVSHKPTTDTDSVYILLESSRFFSDCKVKDEVQTEMKYEASTGIAYPFAYDLKTGETTFSNEPLPEFENTYMLMTPITRWRLRLPATAYENKGLAFPTATSPDSTTQITVTFSVTAVRSIVFKTVLNL